MSCPEDLRYTKDHEWVRFSNGIATIGITAFAQEELGEIVFVELPDIGRSVSSGDSFCVVESTKAASDVYAPVAGEVAEVNESLGDSPDLVNTSPFENGWIVKLQGVDEQAVQSLLSVEEYSKLIDS